MALKLIRCQRSTPVLPVTLTIARPDVSDAAELAPALGARQTIFEHLDISLRAKQVDPVRDGSQHRVVTTPGAAVCQQLFIFRGLVTQPPVYKA